MWCFLLFHFVSTVTREIQALFTSLDLAQSGDFDEILSLRQVIFISLRSKTQALVKYHYQPLYLKGDLTELLENLSKSLVLLKVIDKALALDVWEQAFAAALNTYTFYFVLTYKESFEESSPSKYSSQKSLVDSYDKEVQRLAEFFGGFVRAKASESIVNQGRLFTNYLKALETDACVELIKALISSRTIKSNQLLVKPYD